MMHVGYVLKKFPRVSETFILNEILALQRHGAEVTVFSLNRPDDGVFHRGLSELRKPVVYLTARRGDAALPYLRENRDWLTGVAPALFGQLHDLLDTDRTDVWNVLGWAIDLAACARRHGIEHLHAHFATVAAHVARAAGALLDVPFSVTCHAKDIYRTGIDASQFRALLAPAAFAVTVCQANRRWIETELAGDRPIHLHVLYNGVDTERFNPAYRHESQDPFVLAVGRLVEKKGFHVLLEALAVLSRRDLRPRCLVVGDGEQRDALVAQCRQVGLERVEFLGLRSQDEVRAHMLEARMLVLPCIVGEDGNRDALPTVLLEAQAAGVPVISTAVGGVEEIVDNGRAGVLVPQGDAARLADAIATLWCDAAVRSKLALAGRERALQQFDLSSNVARLQRYFASAIGARAALSGVGQ